jgi:phosphoserine phosphatase
VATHLVVEDGKYNGEVAHYVYGPNKAVAMQELAEREGYDLSVSYAYSDSETDAPMLEIVGHPFAVNPDRGLRRMAEERGWPILSFTRSVPLRTRLGLDDRVAAAAVAAAAMIAVALVAAALTHRRRRPRIRL